ncbi:unnamed protein product [Hydatigera taeniaeformis]|uniref:Ovule protein n=1 Tax=Hydatigena taeniaeformis TaxID=6205 RepID=A0A0R3WVQ1_HYDTA|nr:unnamed protein product [Hydatigera taeniaeformis]
MGLKRIDKEDFWAEDVEEAKSLMAKRKKQEEGGGKGKKPKNDIQPSRYFPSHPTSSSSLLYHSNGLQAQFEMVGTIAPEKNCVNRGEK